jgi:hypothetical protein
MGIIPFVKRNQRMLSYNEVLSGCQPGKVVEWWEKPTFQRPPLSSSSEY